MDNEKQGEQVSKTTIQRCEPCGRLCLFRDGKCMGCRLKLLMAAYYPDIDEDQELA